MTGETTSSRVPRVGLGMPVYNGEDYLAEAIDSVLAQTFDDFELTICDNASTDGTEEICRHYVGVDDRVRYVRNRWNIGGGPNNNRAFELSRGELYRIANHDDVLEPSLIEKCVGLLDGTPEAVAVYPSTVDINEVSERVGRLDPQPRFASPDPAVRIWEALRFDIEPMAIFGVLRTDVVRQTGLLAATPSADRIWLAELLMHGPFIELEEPLFLHREHPERSTRSAGRGHASMAWWDPTSVRTFAFPYWRMIRNLARAINRSPLSRQERWEARKILIRWAGVNRHYQKLIYDLAIPLRPLIDRLYSD